MLLSKSERVVYIFCIFSGVFYYNGGHLSCAAEEDKKPEWGYNSEENGPKMWPRKFLTCGGQRQSPIVLEPTTEVTLPPLKFHKYWGCKITTAKLTNTGTTVRVTLERKKQPFLRGGPLQDDYIFSELNFHWGPNNSVGSEHTWIGGWRYAMEAQLVHYKKQYGSFEQAVKYSDGITIVAFFMEAYGNKNYVLFNNLVERVWQDLEEVSSISKISQYDATEWFHSIATPYGYYTYNGSLTTPSCAESVIWIVYHDHIRLDPYQVPPFREILAEAGDEYLTSNFRPIQETNDRKILFVKS